MYTGRYFKREIEIDKLKIYTSKLRPNRSWIDLFSLSLSHYFVTHWFDFTNLTDNLSEDEVIIIDSHDDVFKAYQICFWRKDRISDILPVINCPSFKSETKIFKSSQINNMIEFINDQNHTKSIMIENTDEGLYFNLIYGDTIKITQRTFRYYQKTNFLDKLKERYKLWEIDDCTWKPKKIRVWERNFEKLKYAIDQLKLISNINIVKLWVDIHCEIYNISSSNYDTMIFNHSAWWKSDKTSIFMFSGETLAAVYKGNYYNFRLDEKTKKSEDSCIKGKI